MAFILSIKVGLYPNFKIVFHFRKFLFVRLFRIVGCLVGFFPTNGREFLRIFIAEQFLQMLDPVTQLSNSSAKIH